MGRGLPIYAQEPLDPTLDEEEGWVDPTFMWRALAQTVKVYSPQEVAHMAHNNAFDVKDYYWMQLYNSRVKM